jgi:proteasome accessory factor C
MASASDQLARLLSLVPWLQAHPGVTKTDAARAFAISTDQLEKDLQLAFTCELPGRPEVFIDIDYLDSDRISVIDAASIDRPLRLRADEAVALLVGLRSLAAVPGLADRDALDSALAKIEDAAARIGLGLAPDNTGPDNTGPDNTGPDNTGPERAGPERTDPTTAVRQALAAGRRLHLGYWVPSRDEITERDVDPYRVVTVDDAAYLEGYCHASEAVRTFRLDRVTSARVLEVAATAAPAPLDAGRVRETPAVFHASDEDTVVVLELGPEARWVPEYYACEWVDQGPDGAVRVALRTADPRLVVRLVLRLGGAARVVEPDEVAAAVRRAAGEALAAYGVSPSPDWV